MRATIKQIADRSGLSVPTVSRILSGKGALHQEETRERVLQAARDLGYRPNASARAMRRGRFDTIALLQSGTDAVNSLLPADLLHGIQEATAAHAIRLSLGVLPDEPLTDRQYIPKILEEWAADGLLINYNAAIPTEMIALVTQFQIPAIWINSLHGTDCIYPDDEAAGRQATEYLLGLGHTRIAYADFQQSGHYSGQARQQGYLDAMNQASLAPRILTGITPDASLSDVVFAVETMLSPQWPTAILAYAPETLRVLALTALHSRKRIPADLSLMVFATHRHEALHVPVDTLVLPEAEMGRQAVEMLLEKIAEPGKQLPPRAIRLTLDTGWTTAPPG